MQQKITRLTQSWKSDTDALQNIINELTEENEKYLFFGPSNLLTYFQAERRGK